MTIFNQLSFKATHNSYSGNISGKRESLTYQLEQGIRLIELDLHTSDFSTVGDYQIGHAVPGDQVWHQGGNPASNLFSDWLNQIAAWSRKHPAHAPIQVLLDIKDNLALPSAAEGNHGALNMILGRTFGDTLIPASHVGDWPDATAILGRILVVLSGDLQSRTSYGLDHGANPAVSINSMGQVVEVHESEQGNHTLWYWTGQLLPNQSIIWHKHGRYGTGTTPAVAINDGGWIVEVHKSEHHDRLWYQIGRFTPDMDIVWQDSHDYDDGILPTVRFKSPNGLALREIHQSQAHEQNWDWSITLHPTGPPPSFSSNSKTSDPRWLSNYAGTVSVCTGEDYSLFYSTDSVERGAICYEQIAFIEYQDGESDWLRSRTRFAAASASDSDFLIRARLAGQVTRGWQFAAGSPQLQPPVCYPATDKPYEAWYETYCASIGTTS